MLELISRIALAAIMIVSVVLAYWQHDKVINSYRYNAIPFITGVAVETALIWLAGGWG